MESREGLHLFGWGWGLPAFRGCVRGFPGCVKLCGDLDILSVMSEGLWGFQGPEHVSLEERAGSLELEVQERAWLGMVLPLA